MWAVARYDLNLTDDQFLDITPAQFFALVERRNLEKQEADYRAGVIASNIVRVFCDKNESKRYTPGYFFPSLKTEKERRAESVAQSPEGIKAHLMAFYPPAKKG